jgi:CRISPR-associated protein Cmr5
MNLDQEAAAFAWNCVGEAPNEDYVNTAKAAPSMIMANGLMQTLAFYEAKRKDRQKEKDLRKDIMAWLGRRMGTERPNAHPGEPMGDGGDFRVVMRFLQNADSDQYMRATEEALAVLKWIRQFADAKRQR